MKITKKEMVIALGALLAESIERQDDQFSILAIKEAYKTAFIAACPIKDRAEMRAALENNAVIAAQISCCKKRWHTINLITPKKAKDFVLLMKKVA